MGNRPVFDAISTGFGTALARFMSAEACTNERQEKGKPGRKCDPPQNDHNKAKREIFSYGGMSRQYFWMEKSCLAWRQVLAGMIERREDVRGPSLAVRQGKTDAA